MGLIKKLLGKIVYLDANIFIYAIEHSDIYERLLNELFKQIDYGKIQAITSELTLAEVLVKPFADGNTELVDVYKNLLVSANIITLLEINQEILLESAKYRATFGGKLPDAIHITTAIASNANFLLTNDNGIKTSALVEVLQLSNFVN
ncbi:MAG: type II toxin-antitoxin system VapC family toxin [Thiomargarita sp.]|nr:type II toxin-antitoxin system VapC family toxin [Thiomargarita sp.]